jgi:hypothetical protein
VLWHILCRPVAHFVPSCGTFCAADDLWQLSQKVFLCRAVAHKSKRLFVAVLLILTLRFVICDL